MQSSLQNRGACGNVQTKEEMLFPLALPINISTLLQSLRWERKLLRIFFRLRRRPKKVAWNISSAQREKVKDG